MRWVWLILLISVVADKFPRQGFETLSVVDDVWDVGNSLIQRCCLTNRN